LDVIDSSHNPNMVQVCSSPDQVSSKHTSAQAHLWLTIKAFCIGDTYIIHKYCKTDSKHVYSKLALRNRGVQASLRFNSLKPM